MAKGDARVPMRIVFSDIFIVQDTMRILGIETSCDETSAAIIDDQGRILSNIVLSQLKEHSVFGGVVPEIAARAHLDHLDKVIEAALKDAECLPSNLDAIAATAGPGLIGGVLVGLMTAKAIAASQNVPFYAINHLEGHALTPRLIERVAFPYLLLLISGGHTQILVVEDVGSYKRWGTTLDDAAGECFDKSAKLMGLPYPGGPNLEKTALQCDDPDRALRDFPLPHPLSGQKNREQHALDFSFSGLKTAVRVHKKKIDNDYQIIDLSYSFQVKIAEILQKRCAVSMMKFKAAYNSDTPSLVVSGGVAANQMIRDALAEIAREKGFAFFAPPLSLCSDNAAMIAWAGLERIWAGYRPDNLDFAARPRWPLDPNAVPRHGAGIKA